MEGELSSKASMYRGDTIHQPGAQSSAPEKLRFKCRDCRKRFTDGVDGESRKSGARCIKCLRDIFGPGYKLNPRERTREVSARRLEKRVARYGLTPDGHAVLVRTQQGSCAICGYTPPEGHELVIDHNHGTNEVRGLLCGRCNAGLGMFGDDPDRLDSAALYLEERGYEPVSR